MGNFRQSTPYPRMRQDERRVTYKIGSNNIMEQKYFYDHAEGIQRATYYGDNGDPRLQNRRN